MTPSQRLRIILILTSLPACSAADPTERSADPDDPAEEQTGAQELGAGSCEAAGPGSYTTVIHDKHRYVENAYGNPVMHGGWGPHLGHLLRRDATETTDAELWFADDACAQPCNVQTNQRVDYLRLDGGQWTPVGSLIRPAGIQQNSGSLLWRDAAGVDRIQSFGIDTVNHMVVQCTFNLDSGAKACGYVFDTPTNANYIGAALTPKGYRMVWWTNVADGGGGSFSFIINYGGGWNGPRTNHVGGYNDASYVHIGFGVNGDPDRFRMLGELVSGYAPSWGFRAGAADGFANVASGITWATPFKNASNGAYAFSTRDIAVDPTLGHSHVFSAMSDKTAGYYFRASGSSAWIGPVSSFPAPTRAVRLTFLGDGSLAMARALPEGGVGVRFVPRAALDAAAATPLVWSDWPEHCVALPEQYGDARPIIAIYPESTVYQSAPTPSDALDIALVPDETATEEGIENTVIHAHVVRP